MPFSSLSGLNSTAGELDAHVAHGAAVVVGVVAAVDAGLRFADAFAAGDVHRGPAVDDEAAPVAARALAYRLVARHHDRLLARAEGVQPAATLDDERADAAGLAGDERAGGDVERAAFLDEHRAAQHVDEVARPVHRAGDVTGHDDDRAVDARHGHRRLELGGHGDGHDDGRGHRGDGGEPLQDA